MRRATELFRRYHLQVFRYLRRCTGSAAEAEDLCQEVFVRVVKALRRTEVDDSPAAWVFTVARNVLLNQRRDAGRRVVIEALRAETDRASRESAEPAVRLDLERALRTLAPLDQDVFLLREVGGLGYTEIAAVCDLTQDAVRSRICRARLALRSALSGATDNPSAAREARP